MHYVNRYGYLAVVLLQILSPSFADELDDKTPQYPLLHLLAVNVLRDVAWVAPETAQEILLGAEKRLAQVNDNAISGAGNGFLRKGLPDVIKNAKQAINRYNELSPKVVEKTDK